MMIIFTLLIALYAQTSDICYGVILDAGSSSTKTTVYQWKCREDQTAPEIDISITAPSLRTKPGLSNQYPDQVAQYLADIFKFIDSNVPTEQKSMTPIFLGATAGMRLLSTNRQEDVIDQVRIQLSNSGYLFEELSWARVISGQDEGAYLWLSVNYLLGNTVTTVATIDVGGASTQMAFTTTYEPMNSRILPLSLNGLSYTLYSISYLGYGVDQARIAIVSQGKSGSNIITPCYHSGYSAKWSDDSSFTIQGSGNADWCLQLISTYLNSNCRVVDGMKCGVDQTELPQLVDSMDLYAVSSVATIASFYGLVDFTLPELYQKIQVFCSMNWSTVQSIPSYASNSYVSSNYFMSLYVYQLLAIGYNIPDTKIIHAPVTINSNTPSWGLAAVQYQLAQVECTQDSPFCGAYTLHIWILAIGFILINI